MDQIIHAFRLVPGTDLKKALANFAIEKKLKAAYIITCVGSLTKANLRFADNKEGTLIEGKMEIVSLVGTFSDTGIHLHISLSDTKGAMIGGHLLDGCIVHTTAEIVIGSVSSIEFVRKMDNSTGYKELNIIDI